MLQRQRNDRARPATFAEHAFNLLHADMVRAKLRPGEKIASRGYAKLMASAQHRCARLYQGRVRLIL
jgi:hypothetical protein